MRVLKHVYGGDSEDKRYQLRHTFSVQAQTVYQI